MKKNILSILFLAGVALSAMSQTATGILTQPPCNNDGIYSVSTTGLTLPITYTYYVDAGTVVHANVNSATDQLTNFAMSNNGFIYCQAVGAGNLSAFAQNSYTPAFTFTATGSNPICPATMGTAIATQQSGTTGPFTYSWTNTQTLASYTGNNISVPLGDYSVLITDQTTGCVLSIGDTAISVIQQSSVTATINVTPANCTNGTATAVGSGGITPYTYQWVNGATTPTITGLTQGYYPITVTDGQGCTSNFLGAWIQQNPLVSVNTTITNATCVQSDGSALAFGTGGASPYTYAWSNGQTTQNATGLSGPTSYTVIATDANGCTGQGNAYINVSTPITVTYTSTTSLCTAPTGTATITASGGTAPYTYLWTSPSVNGATISNVAPGSYPFQVTDAVGCIRTGLAVVSPTSTISASASGSTVICPSTNGIAVANVTGSNPPFTYLWNTGATTNQITGLSPGGYSVVITDASSCSVTKNASVSSASPVNVSLATTPATCIFNTDGSVVANVSGGAAPYSFSYTNGTTTQNATGLGVGNYSLTVTDANGCSKTKFFQITNANMSTNCYCTISGNVYVDLNADCNYDAAESGVENIMIHCSGIGYTFTDANGYYSFQVPTGTYTISEQVNAYYPLAACQTNNISTSVVAAAGCNTVVDFANDMNIIHDLHIVTVNSQVPPIPGNVYQQKVIITNDGTVTEAGIQLGYEHDGQIPFVNSTLPSFVQQNSVAQPNHYSVQSGFLTLSPNGSSVMLLSYNTPTNIPLGTVVTFKDSVADVAPIATSWLLDYTPWNNVNTYQTTVIGSYDPNYKEVSPIGVGTPGYISSATTEFDYTIHFQNEGTYFAQNISVTDQLDDDLDWTTLKPGYSDYAYTTTVSETGLVTFKFANINLPWKAGYGDALSSGLINYSIQRKSTNPQGTVFTNTADIYFDYNAPITTNTTVNTLNDAMAGVDEIPQNIGDGVTVDLFPVPAKDVLTIRVNNVSKNESATVNIIDLMGNVVLSDTIELSEGTSDVTQNISNLATGTYLTRVLFTDGSFIVKKIVVTQ